MKTDIDILFENYMKKFSNQYFVQKDEDGVFAIVGRYAKISPYSPEKQLLGVWAINLPPYKKSWLLRKLSALVCVHQDADNEFGAYFDEKYLETVAKVVKATKRPHRVQSEAQRHASRERIMLINARRKHKKVSNIRSPDFGQNGKLDVGQCEG